MDFARTMASLERERGKAPGLPLVPVNESNLHPVQDMGNVLPTTEVLDDLRAKPFP